MITFLFIVFGLISGFLYSIKNKLDKSKSIKTIIGFGVIGLIIGYFLSPFISTIIYLILAILIIYIIYFLVTIRGKIKGKTTND